MCSAISRRTSTCSGGRRSKKSSHASHLPFDPALAEADPLIEDFARFWDEEPSPLERRKPPRRCSNASGRTAAPSSPVRPRHPFVQPRRPATDAGFARTGTGVAGSSPLAPPTNSYAKSRHVPPPRRRGCVLRGTCVKCDKPAQIAAAPRSRCRRATDEDHLDFPGLGEVKEALVRAGARKPTTSGSLRSRPSTTHEALSHEPEHHARKRTRARSAVEADQPEGSKGGLAECRSAVVPAMSAAYAYFTRTRGPAVLGVATDCCRPWMTGARFVPRGRSCIPRGGGP
jgi:hypothetical protein